MILLITPIASERQSAMSLESTSRSVFGVSHETIVRRILATFDKATPADVEAGATWYGEAGALCDTLATGPITREHVAAVIAQLSPRTTWSRNVAGAVALIANGPDAARSLGCIGANVDRAAVALESSDPLSTINGPKTASFARNIVGDREAVTVDVWAARVADLDETLLSRKGAYDAVAHAYRVAARRRGVDPATMQATTWIVARNGRAA